MDTCPSRNNWAGYVLGLGDRYSAPPPATVPTHLVDQLASGGHWRDSDWVPFPKDALPHEFDGTPCYDDMRKGEHQVMGNLGV